MGLVASNLAGDVSAQAPVGLTRVGPVDPASGFPQYYEDATGLRLGLCQDPAVCFFALPNPALPIRFPAFNGDPAANYPDEQFYWAANADMTGTGARLLYVSALEAAFVNGAVEIGQQMVFTRLRIRLTGLTDGATYTITHPYGSQTLVAGVDGPLPGTINITEDIGAGAAGQFGLAVSGNVGPFLTPLGFVPGGPGTFIADGATLVRVQGSPLGTNFIRLSGPGAGLLFPANALDANTAQLNDFVLQGQIATAVGVGISKAYIAKSPVESAVNVWAFAASGSLLQASVAGSLPVSLTERGTSGQFFGRVLIGAAAAPTSVSVTNLTDIPATSATLSPLTDLVTIQSAVFTVGGDLVITASSSDKLGSPALTASGDGLLPRVLVPAGAGSASAAMGIAATGLPPETIRVASAEGGSLTVPVSVENVPAPPATPVVANAGPDQTVAAGASVALSGLASTGPITSFAWTHNAGALINLLGAATATPSFTAPTTAAGVDIVLTLTVRDALGNASTDSVIVHVNPGAPQPQNDVLVVTDARFIVNRNSWRASGTASLRQGQTISIYLGAVGNTARLIGTATVNAVGAWALQTAQGSGPTPLAADTTIWVSSSLGGNPVSAAFRRN